MDWQYNFNLPSPGQESRKSRGRDCLVVGYRRGLTRNYNGKQPQPPPRLLNSHLAMTKVMTVPITYGTKSEEEKDMDDALGQMHPGYE